MWIGKFLERTRTEEAKANFRGVLSQYNAEELEVEYKTADFSRQAKERKEREAEEKKKQADREKQEREEEKQRDDEAGIGRSAMGLLPKGVREEFARSVQKVAKGLQDGDQGGEFKELSDLMNRLAAAVEIKGSKTELNLKNLSERIKKLEIK
jgi:hypothetical protein